MYIIHLDNSNDIYISLELNILSEKCLKKAEIGNEHPKSCKNLINIVKF